MVSLPVSSPPPLLVAVTRNVTEETETVITAMIAMMMIAAGVEETMTGWARCCRREGVENVTEEEGRNVTEDMEEEKIVTMTTSHHTRAINLCTPTQAQHTTTITTIMYRPIPLTTAMEGGLQ